MKKGVAILVWISYTLCVFGVVVSFHYCGNKLNTISLATTLHEQKCCCGNKEMPPDCCKDETTVFEKSDELFSATITLGHGQGTNDGFAILPFLQWLQPFVSYSTLTPGRACPLKPPPLACRHLPLYILHAVFRI